MSPPWSRSPWGRARTPTGACSLWAYKCTPPGARSPRARTRTPHGARSTRACTCNPPRARYPWAHVYSSSSPFFSGLCEYSASCLFSLGSCVLLLEPFLHRGGCMLLWTILIGQVHPRTGTYSSDLSSLAARVLLGRALILERARPLRTGAHHPCAQLIWAPSVPPPLPATARQAGIIMRPCNP